MSAPSSEGCWRFRLPEHAACHLRAYVTYLAHILSMSSCMFPSTNIQLHYYEFIILGRISSADIVTHTIREVTDGGLRCPSRNQFTFQSGPLRVTNVKRKSTNVCGYRGCQHGASKPDGVSLHMMCDDLNLHLLRLETQTNQ